MTNFFGDKYGYKFFKKFNLEEMNGGRAKHKKVGGEWTSIEVWA